jgi:putative sigma-54 modulation protein
LNVFIHTRDLTLPEALRSYAEQKIRRLDRHFDRILDARLELDRASRKSVDPAKTAELRIHVNGSILKGRVSAREIREAVDLVVDKIDEQLRRRKERIKEHSGPGRARG